MCQSQCQTLDIRASHVRIIRPYTLGAVRNGSCLERHRSVLIPEPGSGHKILQHGKVHIRIIFSVTAVLVRIDRTGLISPYLHESVPMVQFCNADVTQLISAAQSGLAFSKPGKLPGKTDRRPEVVQVFVEHLLIGIRRIRPDKVLLRQIIGIEVRDSPQPFVKAAGLPSEQAFRASHYAYCHAVQHMRHAVVFVADAQVERQIAIDLPVVLEEKRILILVHTEVAHTARFRRRIAPGIREGIIDKIVLGYAIDGAHHIVHQTVDATIGTGGTTPQVAAYQSRPIGGCGSQAGGIRSAGRAVSTPGHWEPHGRTL